MVNRIGDLITTGPDQLRSHLETLSTAERVDRCARFRTGDLTNPTEATKAALRTLARQHQTLTVDLDALDRRELRAARTKAGLTLIVAAEALDTWPARISELERGASRNDELEYRYRLRLGLQVA